MMTVFYYIFQKLQECSETAVKQLIINVSTRWNSSYDMVTRYLEVQTQVFSVLTELKVQFSILVHYCNDSTQSTVLYRKTNNVYHCPLISSDLFGNIGLGLEFY